MAENITAHMDKSLESLKHNFSKVRTGRANANILSDISVDYYGVPTPVTQVAAVKTPEAHMLFFVRLRVKCPLFNLLRRILLVPQLLFVNRLRNSKIPYSMGANWCSLTYNTTKLLVHLYHEHRNVFKYTTNSDEHYKQMLLGNNPHVNISSTGNLRYVVFDTA